MILGYARVSTVEQAAEGTTSLQEQERAIRAFAMAKGVAGYDCQIFVDAGISGSLGLKYRPAGYDLLQAAKPGDYIVASKLDRIFRDLRDAINCYCDFKERGIHLVLFDLGIEPVTSDNSIAKVLFTVMSAFADHERMRIRERIMIGKQAKAKNGGHSGGEAPYGWRITGHRRTAKLEPVEDEQKVLREVKDLGYRDVHQITRLLNNRGFRTRTGKRFIPLQVQRMQKNMPKYLLQQ